MMLMAIFLVVGLIIGAAAVVFVLQNITPVDVHFFNWHIDGSLSVILLLALLTGMLISVLILLPSFIKAEWRLRKLVKENRKLTEDLAVNSAPRPSAVTEPMPVGGEPTVDFDQESK
jgi:lipopolysaccharide assembly protein A